MTAFEAPLMSLRPSSPKVQAAREEAAAKIKASRARRKLDAAIRKADREARGSSAEGVEGLSAFLRWYDANFSRMGFLDILSRDEEVRFRTLARAAYTNTLTSPDAWTAAVRALRDRHKEARIALEERYWRYQRSYRRSASRDGW